MSYAQSLCLCCADMLPASRTVCTCPTVDRCQHVTKDPDVNHQKANGGMLLHLGNTGWSTPQRSMSLGRGSPWGASSRGPPSVASSKASISERPQQRPPPIKREYSGAHLASGPAAFVTAHRIASVQNVMLMLPYIYDRACLAVFTLIAIVESLLVTCSGEYGHTCIGGRFILESTTVRAQA